MILRHRHRVLVQGITGKQGTFWTEAMQACGTAVVGGVHPTKAGSVHLGVPVFASAREADEAAPFDVTVMIIPPLAAKEAGIHAFEAGAGMVVCRTGPRQRTSRLGH